MLLHDLHVIILLSQLHDLQPSLMLCQKLSRTMWNGCRNLHGSYKANDQQYWEERLLLVLYA
jgi:hypothetical protein